MIANRIQVNIKAPAHTFHINNYWHYSAFNKFGLKVCIAKGIKISAPKQLIIITKASNRPISAWKRKLDMKYQIPTAKTIVIAVIKIARPLVKIA